MLPTFLIIGAQKAGTTWLASMLSQHPDVYIPPKEVHYFDKDYNYRKGVAWYAQHFAGAHHQSAVGEKTPDYLWANGQGVEGHLPDVHRNIFETLPWARLVVSLRNPVDRAISAVKHIIGSGRISPLHALDDLLTGPKRRLVEGHGVLEYGLYYRQIQAYLQYFDRSQLLVMIYEEDILDAPSPGLSRLCRFLGIDSAYAFRGIRERVNAHHHSLPSLLLNYHLPLLRPVGKRIGRHLPTFDPRPSRDVLDRLYDLYAEENQMLFEFLGRPPVAAWVRKN